MATLYGQIEELSKGTDMVEYAERLEQYFLANGIDNNEKKRAIFLTVCGATAYGLLRSLTSPAKPKDKSFIELIQLLKTHFNPKPLVIAERFKFWKTRQTAEESCAEFVSKLKKLSEYCDFGDFLPDALRDCFVIGIKATNIQKKLLSKEKLDIKQALEIAVAIEEAEKQAQDISKCSLAEVNNVNVVKNPGNIPFRRNCFRCGKNNHTPDECYFRELECYRCKSKGHISRQCNRDSNPKSNDNMTKLKKKPSKIRYVVEEGYSEEDEELQHWPVYTIFDLGRDRGIKVPLSVNQQPMVFELDTGASLSIISEEIYKKQFKQVQLFQSNKLLKTYSGEPLVTLGYFVVNVEYEGKNYELPLEVVKGQGPALFGRNWLRGIKLNWKDINAVSTNTSIEQKIEHLKTKYNVLKEGLGTVKGFTAKLQLQPDYNPKFFKPRPVPYALKEKINDELDRLEKLGVVEKVNHSAWAAPIVPVLKPTGTVRICGDYKVTINSQLQVPEHPLPTATDVFANLNGGMKFSKLDLSNAYQQVVLDEASRDLVTINTHRGLYRYTRLPYGVASAPADFQKIIEQILEGLEGVQCILDDLLLTAPTDEEHLKLLDAVLYRLDKSNVKLNPKKCAFLQPAVEYFAFIIDKDGVHPSPEKVKAITEMPEPKTVEQLQSALGVMNYYRRFIPNMSTLLAPLNALLQKGVTWNWSKECKSSYTKVKQTLASSQVLVHYSSEKQLVLEVDASPVGLGAVISHDADGVVRPIAYASRTLSSAEKNYSQIEKEALAIIFGLQKFHQYLYGRKFVLYTDHKPLTLIFGSKTGIPVMAASRIQRWAIQLSAYRYDIRYRRSNENLNADSLSRLPLPTEEAAPAIQRSLFWNSLNEEAEQINHAQLQKLPVTAKTIAAATQKDPLLCRVRQFITVGWPTVAEISPEVNSFFRVRDELSIEEGCILRGIRVVIPPQLRAEVLNEVHENHPGIVRMKTLVRLHIWWPELDQDIENLIATCTVCKTKRQNAPVSPSNPWLWPNNPWQRVHIDYAGPFMGEMFLVCVDSYSKWPEVMRLSAATSESTINALRFLFSSHGLPEVIVSDNGPQFTAGDFKDFLSKNGVKHIYSPPYNPRTNGQAEIMVKTFKSALKAKLSEPGSLNRKLAAFLLSYRTTPHTTTKTTPSELFVGRRIRTRLDLMKPKLHDNIMKRTSPINIPEKGRRVEVGDAVLVRDYRSRQEMWKQGVVIYKLGPVTYNVQVGDLCWKRHIDQIKPCLRPVDPEPIQPNVAEVDLEPVLSNDAEVDPESAPLTDVGEVVVARTDGEPTLRRSTRTCQKPAYLRDFET